MAHQYHPDKNGNDPYAAAQFETIKEAYEVLTNPSKKAYYLQQRWYDQVMNKKPSTVSISPVTILKQCIELDQYVARLDVHRMDQEGLYSYITDLLSDETVERLNRFDEKDINDSIVESVLKTCRSLPFTYSQPLAARLLKLFTSPGSEEKIKSFVFHSKRAQLWNQYKIWLLLVIVTLICCLIYVMSA